MRIIEDRMILNAILFTDLITKTIVKYGDGVYPILNAFYPRDRRWNLTEPIIAIIALRTWATAVTFMTDFKSLAMDGLQR